MTIEDRVTQVLMEQLGVHEDQVVPGANIEEDLEADSLDRVELVLAVEDEFGIHLSDEEADTLETVGDIVELVTDKKRG